MASSTPIGDGLPEHEYLNPIDENPTTVSTTVQQKPAPASVHKIAIVGLILFALASAVPILQYYIGWRYSDKCPLDSHIPHYLIVAGAVGIVVSILGIIQNILTLKVSTDGAQQTSEVAFATGLFYIVWVIAILLSFLFIWFISGCIRIFRSWKFVQYVDPNQGNYCHPVLYRFTFWCLIISFIFKIASCVHSCWVAPRELKKIRLRRSKSSTTTMHP